MKANPYLSLCCPCAVGSASGAPQTWRGPFLQHRQQKQCLLALAAAHYAKQHQCHALGMWQAHAAAAKEERRAIEAATHHMQQQLLYKAMAAWHQVCQEAAAELHQLAAEAAPAVAVLAVGRRRRVVAAWRHVAAQQQQKRDAVSHRAQQALLGVVLKQLL